MTGRRIVITNLINFFENKNTMIPFTVIADMFNKNFDKFATTVEGVTTPELKECIENFDGNDDIMFASPTNMTEVFKSISNMKIIKAVGNDGVSAEVLQTSLPMIIR